VSCTPYGHGLRRDSLPAPVTLAPLSRKSQTAFSAREAAAIIRKNRIGKGSEVANAAPSDAVPPAAYGVRTGSDPRFRPFQLHWSPRPNSSPAKRPEPRLRIQVRPYVRGQNKAICESTDTKNPSVATRSNPKKERSKFQTPAPASTLVFKATRFSGLKPIANRGQVSKNYYINSGSSQHPAFQPEQFTFQRDRCHIAHPDPGLRPSRCVAPTHLFMAWQHEKRI